MTLQEWMADLGITARGGWPADYRAADLTDDSRRVTPGCLFIARPGTQADGGRFIREAITRGATAVLVEAGSPTNQELPTSGAADGLVWLTAPRVDNAFIGEVAERYYGRPSRRLKLVGITGTKGKTTVAFVIQHLLQRAGVKTGMIGTVVIDDGERRVPAELTTPGAIDFSRHLAAMVRHGCAAAVAEVSSHALHQGRTAALRFDAAVFTNLTGDHLDYHGTMDAYADAKAVLFRGLAPDAWAVINRDDPYADRMIVDCRSRVVDCSIPEPEAFRSCEGVSAESAGCRAGIVSLGTDHSRVRFDGPWGSFEVRLPLVGRHNVANVLQAVAAANCVAALSKTLRDALATCPAPPGRLEPVRVPETAGEPAEPLPTVLVDYAHTHDALEKALQAVRPLTRGKLVVVFGCGGDRDKTKRPKMAAVACRLADRVVITSDNPRTEDPQAIIRDIVAGVPGEPGVAAAGMCVCPPRVSVEPDRAKAIAAAVAAAAADDLVLIAGKGHEDYQIIGTTKRHFDDREHAAEALRLRGPERKWPIAG